MKNPVNRQLSGRHSRPCRQDTPQELPRFLNRSPQPSRRTNPALAGFLFHVRRWCCLVAAGLFFSAGPLTQAQDYTLAEHAIGSGSAVSQAGDYSLAASLEQPFTGIITGGNYMLVSGFWSRNEIFTTPNLPLLNIENLGNTLSIAWTSSLVGLQLQEADRLDAANWTDVTQAPVYNGATARIVLASFGGQKFYRLRWPSI
jgi:hypothetical protein